jgi:hypothetical protein
MMQIPTWSPLVRDNKRLEAVERTMICYCCILRE